MKKVFAIILILVMVLGAGACGSTVEPTATPEPETPEPFNLEEYKSLILENTYAIVDEALLLGNMGMYQYEYWKAHNSISATLGGDSDVDDIVEKGRSWLAEEAGISTEALDINHDLIWLRDSDIKAIKIEGSEAQEISEYYDSLIAAYDDLHQLTNSPPSDIEAFVRSLSDYYSGTKDYAQMLIVLLGGHHPALD